MTLLSVDREAVCSLPGPQAASAEATCSGESGSSMDKPSVSQSRCEVLEAHPWGDRVSRL